MKRNQNTFYGTTIVCVRRAKKVAIAGDGQVTLGNSVIKGNAKKIRKLYNGVVISGFAGAVADALSLYERVEKKLESLNGDLLAACVELAKDWRMDKYLRKLEAMIILADKNKTFLLSGNGEIFESEDGVIAIGSGGDFARSAALALLENTKLQADEIASKSIQIASKICIYTNDFQVLETLS